MTLPGLDLPLWTLAPFAGLLGALALLPMVAPAWWHRRHPYVVLAVALPTVLYFLGQGGAWSGRYLHALQEYVSFVVLIGSLYVISGGVLLAGNLAGTPGVNTLLLALGALLASAVGTTGASMLLIRPLLQANRHRPSRVHQVVFFIFLVANAGGCLTPLGDPPLFLGYLRGVPFGWTLGLAGPWALVCGLLLGLFYLVDRWHWRRAPVAEAGGAGDPLRVEGAGNLVLLALVVAVIWLSGRLRWHTRCYGLQEGLMVGLALLSWRFTRPRIHQANRFGFAPVREVAVLFAGIFATMVPALLLLEAAPVRWPALRLEAPWQYFWATGLLSSLLDNAPTYLSFAAMASGSLGVDPSRLGELLAAPGGALLLEAVSLGAVFMGAMTYIGNGPNFMVKAIAEEAGVPMPSFPGYLAWSAGILLPVLGLATFVFLR